MDCALFVIVLSHVSYTETDHTGKLTIFSILCGLLSVLIEL